MYSIIMISCNRIRTFLNLEGSHVTLFCFIEKKKTSKTKIPGLVQWNGFSLKKYKSCVKSQHRCLVLFSWNAVATRENGMQRSGREGRVRWGWGGLGEGGGAGGVVARTCSRNSLFNSLYCMYKYHKAFPNWPFFFFNLATWEYFNNRSIWWRFRKGQLISPTHMQAMEGEE